VTIFLPKRDAYGILYEKYNNSYLIAPMRSTDAVSKTKQC